MSSDYDATEFIDGDFQRRPAPYSPSVSGASQGPRAPTREEVDAEVAQKQQKLAELKRAQEELERERAALEEARRRHIECQTGRQEMLQNLTRGLGLLEEAELGVRRDAEQMAKTVAELRDALAKVEGIREETWTKDNFNVELTRALTALENARMEWNSARVKFPSLSAPAAVVNEPTAANQAPAPVLGNYGFGELCRLGFALTWPLALAVLLGMCALLAVLLRK